MPEHFVSQASDEEISKGIHAPLTTTVTVLSSEDGLIASDRSGSKFYSIQVLKNHDNLPQDVDPSEKEARHIQVHSLSL